MSWQDTTMCCPSKNELDSFYNAQINRYLIFVIRYKQKLTMEIYMRIKIPWWSVTEIIINQLKKSVDDMREAKQDDNKITKDEWKNLLAENMIELIPQLAELLYDANK